MPAYYYQHVTLQLFFFFFFFNIQEGEEERLWTLLPDSLQLFFTISFCHAGHLYQYHVHDFRASNILLKSYIHIKTHKFTCSYLITPIDVFNYRYRIVLHFSFISRPSFCGFDHCYKCFYFTGDASSLNLCNSIPYLLLGWSIDRPKRWAKTRSEIGTKPYTQFNFFTLSLSHSLIPSVK